MAVSARPYRLYLHIIPRTVNISARASSRADMQVYVATGNNYKVPPEYTECQLQRSTTVDECGLPDNYVSKLFS